MTIIIFSKFVHYLYKLTINNINFINILLTIKSIVYIFNSKTMC